MLQDDEVSLDVERHSENLQRHRNRTRIGIIFAVVQIFPPTRQFLLNKHQNAQFFENLFKTIVKNQIIVLEKNLNDNKNFAVSHNKCGPCAPLT